MNRIRVLDAARNADRQLPLPAAERHGVVLMFFCYVTLLAGRLPVASVDVRLLLGPPLMIASLAWLSIASPRLQYGRVPRLRALYAFCGYMALSVLWSPDGARWSDALIDFGALALFVGLAISVAQRLSARSLSSLWSWVYWTGVVYVAAALVAGPGAQGRYSAFGGGPNVFVRVVVLAAIASIGLAAARRPAYLLAIPALLLGAVLSGSRGGLAAFAVVLVFGSRAAWLALDTRARRRLLVIALLALASAPRLLPADTKAAIERRFAEQTFGEGYVSGRDTITRDAWGLFVESPVLGAGADGYFALKGRYSDVEYPHNIALAAAAEGGSVGVAVLAASVIPLLWCSRRTLGLAAGGYVLLASMFSGDFYDARMMWFFLGLGCIQRRAHVLAQVRAQATISSPGLSHGEPSRNGDRASL